MTGWHGIRIICSGGATGLIADWRFSMLALKNPTKSIGLVQSGHNNNFFKLKCNLFSP
jgi:hypothetical protein